MLIALLSLPAGFAVGQVVDDADVVNFDEYYKREELKGRRSPTLPYVREDNVIWETAIWRTVDFRERFNQFFFYPMEKEGYRGRKNIAYMLWDAIVADEMPIFEDSELKIPIDNQTFVYRFTKADTTYLDIIDENEDYHYEAVIIPREFTTDDIYMLKLKEIWYIDKQDSRQKVQIICFALTKSMFREDQMGEREFMGYVDLFWVPMLSQQVRNMLSSHETYQEGSIAHAPTWDQIFDTRMFDSYVTKESNRYDREISDYVTGTDAIVEAQRIENKLFELESDMWEY